ncbi:MAG: I78 family peptidase inhibitor [Pseudomonadota bacterium]
MMRFVILAALVVLTACQPAPPRAVRSGQAEAVVVRGAPPPSRVGADTCGIAQSGITVGMTREQVMDVEILGPVRVVRPGDVVTLDFLENRLNIGMDDMDRVVRLTCG